MKTTKRTFGKFLALALVFLFALTAAVGVLAEPVKGQGSLTVTIRNNEGLPAMTPNQFSVYQIFKGKAHQESEITSDNSAASEWDASEWNNWTLADVEWGGSIQEPKTLVDALQKLEKEVAPWAYEEVDGENVNVFKNVNAEDPETLASVLAAHPQNEFLQSFSAYLMDNKETLKLKEVTLPQEEGKTNPELNLGGAGAADDSLIFTFKEAGYYLFAEHPAEHTGDDHKDDAVAEYMLAVVGQQNILLKASVPTVDKDIVVGGGLEKGDVDGVGDYVQFRLTGTLPKNFGDFDTYKYIFNDTLSKGLDYVSDSEHSLTVRVYESKDAADADTALESGIQVSAGNYSVSVTGNNVSGPETLTVSFTDLKALKDVDGNPLVNANSAIVVTYWAMVNEDAVIGVEGNPNTVDLEYSNDPNHDGIGRTTEKKVYVYAFGLDLTKVGDDDPTKGLSGAGFVLKNKATGTYAQFKNQYVIKTTVDGTTTTTFSDTKPEESESATVTGPVRRLTGWVASTTVESLITAYNDAADTSAKAAAKEALDVYLLESDDKGKIPDVYGLDEGNYTLEEVITPDGYNTMDDFDIEIKADIADNGDLLSVTYTHGDKVVTYKKTYGDGEVPAGETEENLVAHFNAGLVQDTLVNQKAPFLPFTGGIGTTIFYVLGTLLIAGAITYLVIATKKRKNAE